jgi:3-phenylpropionate/cinnamic acid dioxygenase small subunit
MDDAVTQLLAKQAIAELIYRRARAADRGDASLAHACYHPDATERHGKFEGRAADFIDSVSTTTASMAGAAKARGMLHLITNILCDFRDEDHAFVESAYFAYCQMADGTDAEIGGRYLDMVERRSGLWRIAHRDCVFDWSRMETPTRKFWRENTEKPFLFGSRDDADPLYAYIKRGHP